MNSHEQLLYFRYSICVVKAIYLFVSPFLFSTEIFERLPLQERQDSQLLGISLQCMFEHHPYIFSVQG